MNKNKKSNGKNRQLAINMISQIIAFAVSIGVSFVITPYITARLGKEVYGFVGLAYQVTSYISVFTVAFNGMLNIFVATEYHKNHIEEARVLYSSVLQLDIILAIILFLPMTLIVRYIDVLLDVPASSLSDIRFLWALIFGSFLLNLAFGAFSCGVYIKNRLDLTAIRNIESNVIKGILLLSFYFLLAPRVWYVGFAAFISATYLLASNYYYNRKLTPELYLKRSLFSWKAIKKIFGVGIWNTISQFTSILMNGLDLIVANIFIDALAMGYISYAQTVPMQINALLLTVKNAFAPKLTESYAKGDVELFEKDIISSIKICGFLGSIPILGFIVFGTSFYALWLKTLTPDEIIKINILSIMILFPTVFDVYISPLYNVNSIMCKVRIPVIVTLIVGFLNIIIELGLLEVTNLGIYAIEIVTAVLLVLKVFLFTPIYAANNLKLPKITFYKPLFRGLIASIVVLIVYIIIKLNVNIYSWFSLVIVCGFAGILGYVINYFILLDVWEKQMIFNMLKNKLHLKRN